MKTKNEWIAELTEDVIRLKNVGRKTLYLISGEMTNDTATGITNHFLEEGYTVESKKCVSCKNKWDIIISWA